jgi:hypothetical protein
MSRSRDNNQAPSSGEKKSKISSPSATRVTGNISIPPASATSASASDSSPKNTTTIRTGEILVKMMLDSQVVSQASLDDVQFNFCVAGLPSSRESIRECIDAYLATQPAHLTSEQINKLRQVTLPSNPLSVHDYLTALTLRSNSFDAAAKIMIDSNSKLSHEEKNLFLSKLFKVQEKHQSSLMETMSEKKSQSLYDSYQDAVIKILQEAYPTFSDKKIKHELQNAETLVNIKHHKIHVTFSGDVSASQKTASILLQIEHPYNGFIHLGEKQQARWRAIHDAWQNKTSQKNNEWFAGLPEWEAATWMKKISDAIDVRNKNKIIPVAPVVKKGGVIGLRNVMLSTGGIIKYQLVSDSFKLLEATSFQPTLRSSNLIAQKHENTSELSPDEKALTRENIHQIVDIQSKIGLDPLAYPWNNRPERPILLCQTLVRIVGGGDTHVINHKESAIKDVNKETKQCDILYSNHSIGTLAGIRIVRAAETFFKVNTSNLKHLTDPIVNFLDDVVLPIVNKEIKHPPTFFLDYLKKAKQGALTISDLKKLDHLKLDTDKTAHLARIFSALNNYAIASHEKNYGHNYQLHLAALEEIIYQDTGNYFHSSCKSGKDREGMEKCYRNALRFFYHQHGYFPPLEHPKAQRDEFVKTFIQVFRTNHQARLAEFNAHGCQGLKALANVLPADIYKALKENDKHLLRQYKLNSKLNEIGHAAVKADAASKIDYLSDSDELSASEDHKENDDAEPTTRPRSGAIGMK